MTGLVVDVASYQPKRGLIANAQQVDFGRQLLQNHFAGKMLLDFGFRKRPGGEYQTSSRLLESYIQQARGFGNTRRTYEKGFGTTTGQLHKQQNKAISLVDGFGRTSPLEIEVESMDSMVYDAKPACSGGSCNKSYTVNPIYLFSS